MRCLALFCCLPLMVLAFLVLLALLFRLIIGTLHFGGFTNGPCPEAAVAVEKLKLLEGSTARWTVGPLAKADAILNNCTLQDADRIGMAYTAEDQNRIVDCERGGRKPGDPYLEERPTSKTGLVMVEGDMAMPPGSSNTSRLTPHLWANRTLTYCFSSTCTEEAKVAWEKATVHTRRQVPCLQFRGVSTTLDAGGVETCENVPSVLITSEKLDGCWSHVGQVSGTDGSYMHSSQPLNLGQGCESMGMAAHQLGHALGMQHEHSRSDRGQAVVMKLEKVRYDATDKLAVRDEAYTSTTYDVMSLMHGPASAFSRTGEETIEAKDHKFTPYLGQRMAFSQGDVEHIADLYGCEDQASPQIENADLLPTLGEHLVKMEEPWTKKACLCHRPVIYFGKVCRNPNNDPQGPWCPTRGLCFGKRKDYCRPPAGPIAPTTKKGCQCRKIDTSPCATEANGLCCNDNYSPFGPWCYTVKLCFGANFDYCNPLAQGDCTWSEWSRCSVSCGDGVQARSRRAAPHQECLGEKNQTRNCGRMCSNRLLADGQADVQMLRYAMHTSARVSRTMPQHLEGEWERHPSSKAPRVVSDSTDHMLPLGGDVIPSTKAVARMLSSKGVPSCQGLVDCPWAAWTEWSACSAACGGGVRTRSRRADAASNVAACAPCRVEEARTACGDQMCV